MKKKNKSNVEISINLPKITRLYLQTSNPYVILLKKSLLGGKTNLFVCTDSSSVDAKGFFGFHIDSSTHQVGFYKEDVNFKGQGSKKNMVSTVKVNILEAAKYVVQLYYRAEPKYNCTLTKVEKILAIADMITMKDGNELFSDKIVSHGCGVGFPILSSFLYSNIIDGSEEKCEPIQCTFNDTADIPRLYHMNGKLPEYVEKILIDVFLTFGDFTAKDLGLSFNIFKDKLLLDELVDGEQIIDSEKVKNFFENVDKDLLEQSKVYKFIYTYPMVNYGA